ncbi:sigma-70 family RNA polymerase sigma factor [Ideonella sp. DXS22W]|uniref:Sigma-70 family RNA polymerase sigma factor n=1 Tax=Pseudaquabacterium inlustre TaxID=2984192 RepID=A0ABU9CHW2_9BURK
MPGSDPPGAAAAAPADTPLAQTFRSEYRRLVARLARDFGYHLVALAEDAVQAAMLSALRRWPRDGTPAQPGAWLYRVAHNKLVDELRRSEHRNLPLDAGDGAFDGAPGGTAALGPAPDPVAARALQAQALALATPPQSPRMAAEVADDELRMLFVCADEAIAPPSQLVLALKVLGGFSTREIALRLLTSEDNVHKRLARARERLRQTGPELEPPTLAALQGRRGTVLRIIYLLFNEGYHAMQAESLIRRELVDEALRLAHQMAAHPVCGAPEVDALLALMHLHAARFDAREAGDGGLLLLEAQDRSLWDRRAIATGLRWLQRAARGPSFSRYHAEAAVAALHCSAPSYAQTDWAQIVDLYQTLERHEPSPLYTLNRAIALAQWQGPEAGLALLRTLAPPGWLTRYYLWDATLGELERRAGQFGAARAHLQRALDAAPHAAEQDLLRQRLAACTAGVTGLTGAAPPQ